MTLTIERRREIDEYLSGRSRLSRETKMLRDTFDALEDLEYWAAEAREVVKKTLHIVQLMGLEQIAQTCNQLLNERDTQ